MACRREDARGVAVSHQRQVLMACGPPVSAGSAPGADLAVAEGQAGTERKARAGQPENYECPGTALTPTCRDAKQGHAAEHDAEGRQALDQLMHVVVVIRRGERAEPEVGQAR